MKTQIGTVVTPLHGSGYAQSVVGNTFIGNGAVAGAVIPIYSNTTQQFGIFNPAGSGVNVVLKRINIGYIDTTAAAGGLCLGYLLNSGADIATANGGVTAATKATPISARLDGPTSRVKFMSAAITTAAPSLLMALGLNQLVVTATDATTVPYKWDYEFDGSIICPPNTSIFLAGIIAVLVKVAPTFIWEEVPVTVDGF